MTTLHMADEVVAILDRWLDWYDGQALQMDNARSADGALQVLAVWYAAQAAGLRSIRQEVQALIEAQTDTQEVRVQR